MSADKTERVFFAVTNIWVSIVVDAFTLYVALSRTFTVMPV